MSNGKKAFSSSVFSRRGVPKQAKTAPFKARFEASRKTLGGIDAYGNNRTLQGVCPELFVLVNGVKTFDFEKYCEIANPVIDRVWVPGIIGMILDYMGAGYLYPWTALQASLYWTTWATTNGYPNLSSFISVTQENYEGLLNNHPQIFDDGIVHAITLLKSGHQPYENLWSRMQETAGKNKCPPGGKTGLFQCWPEKIILSEIMKGIGRERWQNIVATEVSEAAAAMAADDNFTQGEALQKIAEATADAERNERRNRAEAMKRKFQEDQYVFLYDAADGEDYIPDPKRKRIA